MSEHSVTPIFLIFLFCTLSASAQNKEQRWIVGTINFIGNNAYTKDQLLKATTLQPKGLFHSSTYSFTALVEDIQHINAFYHNRGYLNEEVTEYKTRYDTLKSQVHITYVIYEGERTVIDTIVFFGNTVLKDSLLYSLIGFRKGIFLDSQYLAEGRQNILDKLWEKGYLFAKVWPDLQFPVSNLHTEIVFQIMDGPLVFAGNSIFFGLHRIDTIVVSRQILFSKDSVLTLNLIRQSIASVYSTGLFKKVNIQPLDTTADIYQKDSVHLPVLIQTEEGDFFAIQAGGGYGSYEGWYGTVRLGYKNLFGLGHKIFFSGKASFTTFYAGLDYIYPFVFDVPLNLDFTTYIDRRDLDAFQGLFGGLFLTFSGSFLKVNSYRVWSNYEHSGWIKTVPGASTQEKKNTLLFGINYTRDTRITQIEPGKALFLGTDIELAGPAMSWSNQFVQFRGDLRLYFPFFKSDFSIASALEGGIVRNYGKSGDVPSSQLFRIGLENIRPVRGYDENEVSPVTSEGVALGGKFYLVMNLIQFRFPIYKPISGTLFLDGGYVWPAWPDVDLRDLKFSYGAGLGLNLLGTAFRVEYGIKLDKRPPFLNGKWYLGVGLPF